MKLSIIIPTLNEAKHLSALLNSLSNWQPNFKKEILIVDGGSEDKTEQIANDFNVRFFKCKRGRANQLNFGAAKAKGTYLLFIHADSLLDHRAYSVLSVFMEAEHPFGNFYLQFDIKHWFLKLNAWFSQFTCTAFQYGDQALLVKNKLFREAGGYPDHLMLFEDQEIIRRLKRKAFLVKMQAPIITSARKYQSVGVYKLQFTYFMLYFLYRMGASQKVLYSLYQKLVAEPHESKSSA